ncbi:MAG: S-methyl-5-thioribose-1-phosphate isomerase [Bacteroidales bacterium]|nr:S-methyl-5-thioribose-1-phosphate isomerase [Bacteroidales bacterium]
MRINGTHYRSIWMGKDPGLVYVIDQRYLPFEFRILPLRTAKDAYHAISEMAVRGAPLIGATAAFGLYLAAFGSGPDRWWEELEEAAERLISARPTAVNLKYAVNLLMEQVSFPASRASMIKELFHLSIRFAEDEVIRSRRIGEHGLRLIREIHEATSRPVNILTHCNAGWLACVDYGTATAPIYLAHDQGIPVHVWVDETRPRNQGARLTAYELGEHGVPHTLIVDNAGGHLMQRGKVDLVLVGSDRTTRTGDVANKIGTYLKALAAKDNGIPFYAALPSSTIDFDLVEGSRIEIENRDPEELTRMQGISLETGDPLTVRIYPEGSVTANPGFDVTPARLVSGLITEKGICEASEKGIKSLFKRQGPHA